MVERRITGTSSAAVDADRRRCPFGPASQLRRLPFQKNTIHVNQCVVKPVTVVRDLGVRFDAELSMRSHVSQVAQTCFYHLRRIQVRAVRRQLGRDVTALVLSRLDYWRP